MASTCPVRRALRRLAPVALVALCACGPDPSVSDEDLLGESHFPLPGDVRVRLMSANLTSGNGQSYDPGHGTRIFQGTDPDIVMIQEFNYGSNSNADIQSFVSTAFGPTFSYYREGGAQIPNGIVSRYPIVAFGEWNDSSVANRDFAWARIDIPGVVCVTAGLFGLVFGFSNAETNGWGEPLTIFALTAGAALIVLFVVLESHVPHPLLPLRVVLDRDRGGSYLAIGISGAGMFGVFLFLTYYLQQTLGFTPIQTGLAFLPMSAMIMATATTATTKLVPRVGPRPLVSTGMVLASIAMALLAQLKVDSTYAAHVLPPLLVMGVGLGLIFAPAMSTATLGVEVSDAGVASAMVNTSQQIGGSIGTAVLSTIFSSAVASYATTHPRSPALPLEAAMHGYTTAFWCSSAVFVVGAVVSAIVFRSGAPQLAGAAEPALAH